MQVTNFHTWPGLFLAMAQSDMHIRKVALEDVTAVLHENYPNVQSLNRIKGWQSWIMPLFTDIPRVKKEPAKSCYLFTINILVTELYGYFMNSAAFGDVLLDTLDAVHQFGGYNVDTEEVANAIIASLASKLSNSIQNFPKSPVTAMPWKNVLELSNIVKKFVFQSTYWDETKNAKKDPETPPARTPNSAPFSKGRGGPGSTSPQSVSRTLSLRSGASGSEADFSSGEPLSPSYASRSEMVLCKARVAPGEKTLRDPAELVDHGFHWSRKGDCADVELVYKMRLMFKALHLDQWSPELNPSIVAEEDKNFLTTAVQAFEFWRDAHHFVGMAKRKAIDEHGLHSYRKLSFLVQSFLAGKTEKDRNKVQEELLAIYTAI